MRCNLCPLHKTCDSVKIDSRGADAPVYLFVGEAPGEQEDLRNSPFVGPAGALLIQAIKEYDLKPARLTNTVRCRPPGNREPKLDEVEACKPFLLKEIEQFKPRVVVACGNIALRALTGKNGILKHAGRIVGELNGSKIFAIYHPSYVLRYPYKGHSWEMQLKELKRVAEGATNPEVKVQILEPQKALEKIRNSQEFVTLDFETTGQYKQYGGDLRCVGFHTEGETFIVELGQDKDTHVILDRIAITEQKKCAHNSIFERRWFIDKIGAGPRNLVYDTMLLHYLLDENKPHDLESVVMDFCDVSPWGIEREMEERGWNWATVPFSILSEYCGRDAYYTHLVMKKILAKFKAEPELKRVVEYYKKVLLPTADLCAHLESRGMKIDSKWARAVDLKYSRANEDILRDISKLKKVAEYIQGKSKDVKFKGFNLASPNQVRDIVVDKLSLKPKGVTDGGQVSVDYDSLYPFAKKSKFVSLYLDWKERGSLRNNFLKKFPKFADSNGLIHPSHNPGFQVTSRISVSKPPASNLAREPEVRGIIASRFEGGYIVSLDYRQLEMRLLASEAGEKKMLYVFSIGGDIHNETASEMFGVKFTNEDRDKAKAINFSTVYGIEEYSFSIKYHVDVHDARKWLRQHREIFPGIYKWLAEQHQFIRKNGWIESRFGLRRRLPQARTAEGKELEALFRQAGNFPIQSQGAAITNLAGVRLNEELEKMWETKSVLYHVHHDSLNVDACPGEEKIVGELGRKIMEREIPALCPWLKVRLPVDVKVSKRWGGVE